MSEGVSWVSVTPFTPSLFLASLLQSYTVHPAIQSPVHPSSHHNKSKYPTPSRHWFYVYQLIHSPRQLLLSKIKNEDGNATNDTTENTKEYKEMVWARLGQRIRQLRREQIPRKSEII